MEKQNEIKNHIRDLCYSSGLSPTEFDKRINEAISVFGYNINLEYSTTYRWYTGETLPRNNVCYKCIAYALEKSENEIRTGKPDESESLRNEVNELTLKFGANEEEKQFIIKVLWWEKYNLAIISLFVFEYSSFWISVGLWKNPWLFLASLLSVYITSKYDDKRYRRKMGITSKKTIVAKVKEDIDLFKFLTNKSVVSRFWAIIMRFVLFFIFLPFIEYFIYGRTGTSVIVLCSLGTILLIKAILRK